MKSRGYKSGTAGILTALTIAGGGAAALYYGKKYMDDTCRANADKLNSLINSFLDRDITTPSYNLDVPLNLPDTFPISANITTPNGTFPFNTTAHINLPSSLNIPLGPISDSTKNLLSRVIGTDGVDFLQSLSSETKKDCDSYVTPALLVTSIVVLVALLWLIALTFGFGSKLSAHDYRISKLKDEIKQLKEILNISNEKDGNNSQPLHSVRTVTL